MRNRQLSEAVRRYAYAIALIYFLWTGLERVFYGEIQPRAVDNIVTVAWSVIAWNAYFLGRRHGAALRK